MAEELDSALGPKLSGTVKWFNTQRGYGFITADDGKEYFVHWKGIIREAMGPGPEIRTLETGQRVEFRLRQLKPEHEPEAVAVKRLP